MTFVDTHIDPFTNNNILSEYEILGTTSYNIDNADIFVKNMLKNCQKDDRFDIFVALSIDNILLNNKSVNKQISKLIEFIYVYQILVGLKKFLISSKFINDYATSKKSHDDNETMSLTELTKWLDCNMNDYSCCIMKQIENIKQTTNDDIVSKLFDYYSTIQTIEFDFDLIVQLNKK